MTKIVLLCLLFPVVGWAQTRPIAHRFDMTQNGKSMSANDFDQWLKTKGVRVVGRKALTSPTTFSSSVSVGATASLPAAPMVRTDTIDSAQPGDIVGF